MNSKKANRAFLITVILYIALSYGISLYFPWAAENLFWSNLFCELVVVAPILFFSFGAKEKPASFLGFRKIKPGSVLMIALFTFLSMPLATLLNLFSQFWVENEVALAMESMNMAQMPFGVMYLSVGIIAPLFEEVACRGAFYHAYKKTGTAFGAMILSSVIFALIHMNFNQAAYAFAIGILAVLLVEATGSLWASILYHGLINGSQVLLMYVALKADPAAYSESAALMTNDFLILAVGAYLMIAAVTLPLAWAVLVWLAGHEGREGALSALWKSRKEKKDKMLSAAYVLALILCISIMTGAFSWLVMKILTLTGVISYS